MVINGLLQLLMLFLRVLFLPLKIITLPVQIGTVLADLVVWFSKGAAVVAFYTHFPFILACVSFCVSVESLYFGHDLIYYW